MRENRDFKGVWIPAKIWLNTDLSAVDKCLLAEIDSLDNDKHCFATNAYFSEFLGVSEPTVSRSISKLLELDLIRMVSFDGRRRVIASNLIKMNTLPNQNDKAALSKKQGSIGKKIRQPKQNDMRINTESNSGINTANNTLTIETAPVEKNEREPEPYTDFTIESEPIKEQGAPLSTKIVSFATPVCELPINFTAQDFWLLWHELIGATPAAHIPNPIKAAFISMTNAQKETIQAHAPKYIASTQPRFIVSPTKYISEERYAEPITDRMGLIVNTVRDAVTMRSEMRKAEQINRLKNHGINYNK